MKFYVFNKLNLGGTFVLNLGSEWCQSLIVHKIMLELKTFSKLYLITTCSTILFSFETKEL